jgi:predicted metalloprotease with PDZ domain
VHVLNTPASWDIKPKENPMRLRYKLLAMDESKFVVNKEMDATISFG